MCFYSSASFFSTEKGLSTSKTPQSLITTWLVGLSPLSVDEFSIFLTISWKDFKNKINYILNHETIHWLQSVINCLIAGQWICFHKSVSEIVELVTPAIWVRHLQYECYVFTCSTSFILDLWRSLKRALSQKSLYHGLFTNWPGILWMGFIKEIGWPEMKSTAANDNRRDYALLFQVCRYFYKHYPNRSISDALRICYLNITISWKRYVFYRNGSTHVISFK